MPVISQFYGIIIQMFFHDNDKHHEKHIHVKCNEQEAVYDLKGNILEGRIPYKKNKLVQAWITIHKEELESLWILIHKQGEYFKIEPLK